MLSSEQYVMKTPQLFIHEGQERCTTMTNKLGIGHLPVAIRNRETATRTRRTYLIYVKYNLSKKLKVKQESVKRD